MADDKKPPHGHPEHKHEKAMESEYWDILVSLDNIAGKTDSTCEFAMALFRLAAHILSGADKETRASMLKSVGEAANEMADEMEAAHEVGKLLSDILSRKKPGTEH